MAGGNRCVRLLRLACAAASIAALFPSPAAAQSEVQLWGDVTLNWIKNREWTLGLEIQPKVLASKPAEDPGWATLDVTPSVEYAYGNWLDVVGELLVARTRQTNDVQSTEVTPRLGVRLHILSNLENEIFKMEESLLLGQPARFFDVPLSQPDRAAVSPESIAPDRRRGDLRDGRRGVVLDGRRSRGTVREQGADSCRHRPSAQLQVATRGVVRLGPVATGHVGIHESRQCHRHQDSSRMVRRR